MLPPEHVCYSLYRKYPNLRLGWAGRYDPNNTALNQGSFVVVRLVQLKHCGAMDDPRVLDGFWDVDLVLDQVGAGHTVRANRGPIFNRYGGTRPDWNVLSTKAIMAAVVPNIQMVFNGSVVAKSSIVPYQQHRKENYLAAREEGKALQHKHSDMVDAIVDRVYSDARHSAHSTITHREHWMPDLRRASEKVEQHSFVDRFVQKRGLKNES